MSDGMKTVNLIEKVLDYECSVDDAITIETMMFKNMRTEIERLTAELARYKQGVEVDGLVAYENYPWPIRILDTALEKFHHECVRVLVMKVEW